MEEKNKHILEEAFKQLPEFKADVRIWDKIVQQLNNEVHEKNYTVLKKSIYQLRAFKADASIWNKIEKELDGKSNTAPKFYLLKIAAFITVVIGLSILINNGLNENTQREFITFSQEQVLTNTIDASSMTLERELNDVIEQQCAIQPDICMNPAFIELKKELLDLTKSLNQLKILSNNSDNDPEARKFMLRIQKERVEISKKIFHFLNS